MSVLINARISVSDKRVSVSLNIVSILQNFESVKYRKPQIVDIAIIDDGPTFFQANTYQLL